MMTWTQIVTPVGSLKLIAADGHLVRLLWPQEKLSSEDVQAPSGRTSAEQEVLSRACQQLTEYFAGERQAFTVPTSLDGTDFQQEVWSEVALIPYGQTATYGRIAKQLGRPDAAQAVGAAIAKNPLCIFIPCHRVVGSDRSLVGYAGGLVVKRDLLQLEYQHGPGRLGETVPLPLE